MTERTPFSIEAYCAAQPPLLALDLAKTLPDATRIFLERLHLPRTHPFCDHFTDATYALPNVPAQGPLLQHDYSNGPLDYLVTLLILAVPSLLAMAGLWLRLLALAMAPLGTLWLMWWEAAAAAVTTTNHKKQALARRQVRQASAVCVLSVASSVVLLTDTLYVLEFGPRLGGTLLIMTFLFSWRHCGRHDLHRTKLVLSCLVVLMVYLVHDWHSPGRWHFGTAEEHTSFPPGLYHHDSNALVNRAVSFWPPAFYNYDSQRTWWMPTGDARTGLSFLLHHVPAPVWYRVWMPVENDNEVVALDIAFPHTGYDATQPLYLVLHGLNGGSKEAYVQDFAQRRIGEHATVIVLVARGLMNLPVRGWNVFHGARWTDAHAVARHLQSVKASGQILAGVGYSMGGIILNNMVAQSGADCALDVAVSVSGGLEMRVQAFFWRAQRLWQPMVAATLRDEFVLGKWGERTRARLTRDQMRHLMRATHITEVDQTAVVAYNGFRDLEHYYSEMGAMGDVPLPELESDALAPQRRIQNVSIPLLVIHALDDPLITWRTVAANHHVMHPNNLVKTGHGNLLLLLTKRGGHVGWATGITAMQDKWKWMSDVSASFVNATMHAKAELAQQA